MTSPIYKVRITDIATGKTLIDQDVHDMHFTANHNYLKGHTVYGFAPVEQTLISTDFHISGTWFPPKQEKKKKQSIAARIGKGWKNEND